jgi:hypothetical protein
VGEISSSSTSVFVLVGQTLTIDELAQMGFSRVGRCTLTPPDPQLKAACLLSTLNLSSEKSRSKFAFQIQLALLQPGHRSGRGGALHVESS